MKEKEDKLREKKKRKGRKKRKKEKKKDVWEAHKKKNSNFLQYFDEFLFVCLYCVSVVSF